MIGLLKKLFGANLLTIVKHVERSPFITSTRVDSEGIAANYDLMNEAQRLYFWRKLYNTEAFHYLFKYMFNVPLPLVIKDINQKEAFCFEAFKKHTIDTIYQTALECSKEE